MTTQLHDTGEEYILDVIMDQSESRVSSVDIGLYNDNTDALNDDDDVGDIDTEPLGSNYSRQSVTLSTSNVTNEDDAGDWRSKIGTVTFDTSDSSQNVDAYFIVINFQSDDTGDSSANDHLLLTGQLDQEYYLGQIDQFDLSDAGMSIT